MILPEHHRVRRYPDCYFHFFAVLELSVAVNLFETVAVFAECSRVIRERIILRSVGCAVLSAVAQTQL